MENNRTILKGARTKTQTFDMTTKRSTPKQTFRLIVPDLIHKAEQFLKARALDLPVGTYTARDIHHFLNKTYSKYFLKDKAQPFLFNRSCRIDVNSTQWVVQDSGIYSFPWFNVFYVLWKCETFAGLSGSKAHKFIVKDKRECVSESIITFFEEKQAKKLSTMMKQNNYPQDKPCQMSLSDGCIRCTYSASREKDYKGRIHKRRIEAYDGFLLSPSEYTVPDDFIDICVRFDAQQLRHLYGKCKIRIFMNKESIGPIQNPHNIRVTIENPDGWIIASDIIEYKIKYLNFEGINDIRQELAQNEAYDGILRAEEKQHNYECANDTKGCEDYTDTLNIKSADSQNETTKHTHQKVQPLLPYRKLPSPCVVPSREESIQHTSRLPSSPVIDHLCMQIHIEQLGCISGMYGEGKLRVYIKKVINSHYSNPDNVFLQIETAEGWIVDNEFLIYKSLTPISIPFPAPHVEVRTDTLHNHQPAIRELIAPGSSPFASIHMTEFGLTASQEFKKYCIPTTHTPTREDIEHSVKKLLISRKKNE